MLQRQTYSISAARWELSRILELVQHHGEHVTLTRYNLPAAVIVPVSDAKKLTNRNKTSRTQSEEKD